MRVLTSTGPLLAEPAKAWLLKRKGLALHQAFASTLSEILFYNLSAVALAAGGLAGLALQFPLEPSMRASVWGVVLLLSGILLVAVVAFARRAYSLSFHPQTTRPAGLALEPGDTLSGTGETDGRGPLQGWSTTGRPGS